MKNLISFNKIFNILTFLVLISYVSSEKRLCGDEKCESVISSGSAISNYNPGSPNTLALRINAKVRIFSKPAVAGNNDLWDVEIQGRRGFAPKKFIKEETVIIKKANIIEVEFPLVDQNKKLNENGPEIKSSEVSAEETTTTAPLQPNEIPKDILKETSDEIKVKENVQSTSVQQTKIFDSTPVVTESENNDAEDDDEDIEVDIDNDDDEEDDDDENDYDISEEDENKIKDEETENSSKASHSENFKSEESIIEAQKENGDESNSVLKETEVKEKTENTNSGNLQKTDNINKNIIDENKREEPQDNSSDEKLSKNIENLSTPGEDEKNVQKTDDQSEYSKQNKNEAADKTAEATKSDIQDKSVENKMLDSEIIKLQEQENISSKDNNSNEIEEPKHSQISGENHSNEDILSNTATTKKLKSLNDVTENKQDAFNQNTNTEPRNDKIEPPVDIIQETTNQNVEFINNSNEIPDSGKEVNETELNQKTTESKNDENKTPEISTGNNEKPEVKIAEQTISQEESSSEKNNYNDNNPNQEIHKHPILHHNHGLPPLFKPKLPSTNTNSKLASDEIKILENIEITTNVNTEAEKSDKDIIKEVENVPNSLNPAVPDSSFDDNDNLIDNKNNEINSQEQETNSDTVHQEIYDKPPLVTSPGYEENIFVDTPVESFTQNPENVQETIAQENANINDLEIQNGPVETTNENTNIENVERENIQDHPVDPQPLTQDNNVQNSNDGVAEEHINENDILTTALETFNCWTGKVIDLVNGFWNNPNQDDKLNHAEMDSITYPNNKEQDSEIKVHSNIFTEEYCEKIGPNDNCPKIMLDGIHRSPFSTSSSYSESDLFTSMSDKILEMFDMLVLLSIAAVSSLIFAFGYYCICNSRKEKFLINKLNIVERSLLAANKEVTIIKQDLQDSRTKLISVEDTSLGKNDMVAILKKELDKNQKERNLLKEQISTLEKELETSSETVVGLNKTISDLSTKQDQQEIEIDNMETLQMQLNVLQDTVVETNETLAEKTHQNNELHKILSDQAAKFEAEITELQNKIEDLKDEKLLMQSKFNEKEISIKEEMQLEINMKTKEIEKLFSELQLIKRNFDETDRKWQTSESKIESLKDCIRNMNKESWADIDDLIETVDIKADNLLLGKEISTLKEKLEAEKDARKLLDDRIKIISEEITTLRKEHNQAEKDKVEAQTRLDVLSNYFKEKEAQLQKDLTVKEALWMKQQGETTSTVERIRVMQDEIQALKSQNDSLHAEIEAQTVAHKTQLAALENRAHETWLLSKQAERKYEEARSESTILRRKLTTLVSSNNVSSAGSNNTSTSNDINRLQNSIVDGIGSTNLNSVPSPIHLDSPSSPPLIPPGLPPPPPFLPPPQFMPPLRGPFMGMPAPFAFPPGGRPPPLGGRLMSPPPMHRRGGRYSPSLIDDDDYDDDDYDDDRSQRRSSRNNRSYSPENNGRYSPDSRYNYTTDVMSNYDTETDFSPQVSPREESFLRGRRGGSINRDLRHNDRSTPLERTNSKSYNTLSPSPQKNQTNSENRNNKSNKGSSSYSYSSSSSSSSSSFNDGW